MRAAIGFRMFANKAYLLFLLFIPILILLLSFFHRKRKKDTFLFISGERLAEMSNVSFGAYKLKNLFLVSAVILLIVTLARPRWGEKKIEVIKEASEIVMALDLSNSMLAGDVKPNRLEAAKALLSKVIADNEGEKMGIIAFAGTAMWRCPMTFDTDALKAFLSGAQTGSMPVGGTQLGSAINLAANAVNAAAQNTKLMILITDGEDHDSEVSSAVKNAADSGLRIITVAVGTGQGAPIPVKNESGVTDGYIKDASGQVVMSRVNSALLGKIAEETGGKYFELSDSAIVQDLSKLIEAAKKNKYGSEENADKKERFQIFLAAAIIAFMISFAIRPGAGIKNEA